MKVYYYNTTHRGVSLDIRFCAKNAKHAAELIGCTPYIIRTYASSVKIETPYNEIYAKPYGSYAVEILGRNEILYSDAIKIIDIAKTKEYEEFIIKLK